MKKTIALILLSSGLVFSESIQLTSEDTAKLALAGKEVELAKANLDDLNTKSQLLQQQYQTLQMANQQLQAQIEATKKDLELKQKEEDEAETALKIKYKASPKSTIDKVKGEISEKEPEKKK